MGPLSSAMIIKKLSANLCCLRQICLRTGATMIDWPPFASLFWLLKDDVCYHTVTKLNFWSKNSNSKREFCAEIQTFVANWRANIEIQKWFFTTFFWTKKGVESQCVLSLFIWILLLLRTSAVAKGKSADAVKCDSFALLHSQTIFRTP